MKIYQIFTHQLGDIMTKQYNSRIVSIGYYVPGKIVKIEEIEKRLKFKEKLGLPYGLIERLTGCREYREGPPDTNATDLAVEASKKAIQHARQEGISRDDIDLILFCSCCQDIYEPATANIVQEKLDISNAQVLDVKNACNSFINGIDVADSMIATGKAKTALVTTGEVLSKYGDRNIAKPEDFKPRFAGLTLADGGGAAVITRSKPEEGRIIATSFESYGTEWRLGVVMAGGTMYWRKPIVDQGLTYFLSDSEKILKLALKKIPPVMLKVLKDAGWRREDIDLVLGHQVTVKIIKDILDAAGIPFEKTIVTVDRYGNTASATIPITMGIALEMGRLKRGMKLLLVGGASGFSVGVLALIW